MAAIVSSVTQTTERVLIPVGGLVTRRFSLYVKDQFDCTYHLDRFETRNLQVKSSQTTKHSLILHTRKTAVPRSQ